MSKVILVHDYLEDGPAAYRVSWLARSGADLLRASKSTCLWQLADWLTNYGDYGQDGLGIFLIPELTTLRGEPGEEVWELGVERLVRMAVSLRVWSAQVARGHDFAALQEVLDYASAIYVTPWIG